MIPLKIVYLRQWLSKIIIEHPEVIDPKNSNQTPEEVYAKLFEYWINDIPEAMKSLLEIIKKS